MQTFEKAQCVLSLHSIFLQKSWTCETSLCFLFGQQWFSPWNLHGCHFCSISFLIAKISLDWCKGNMQSARFLVLLWPSWWVIDGLLMIILVGIPLFTTVPSCLHLWLMGLTVVRCYLLRPFSLFHLVRQVPSKCFCDLTVKLNSGFQKKLVNHS